MPDRRFDRLELGVDIDVLQLIDQDDGGIAIRRDVAGRDFQRQPLLRAIAELRHDLARLGAIGLDVGAIARKGREHIRRHAPDAFGRRQHGRADIALPLRKNVDEGLTVERVDHRQAQVRIVERRHVAIDDQIRADIDRRDFADCVRRLRLDVLEQRDHHFRREGHVELAGDEAEDRGRAVRDDVEFDAVEIGQALLPVVGILHELD